ncbi:cytochrome P450 [Streptomyces sp. NPDC059578]|uniref:cytochrome P450 n=1 Tax=unclassified Streptomyces TaxID=2593676 RepID=UPI0036613310
MTSAVPEGPPPVPLGRLRQPGASAALHHELRRTHGPVAPVLLDDGVPAWLVLGYRELHQVTADPQLFSRDPGLWNRPGTIPDGWPLPPDVGRDAPPAPQTAGPQTSGPHPPAPHTTVLHTTGPRHTERAAVIAHALTAQGPYRLREHAERFADALVDGFCTRGGADVIGQYAVPLPVRVLARLFGFAEASAPELEAALNAVAGGREGAVDGRRRLTAAVGELVAQRRRAPGEDVASRMLADPAGPPEEEIARDLTLMLIAGHRPTTDWIGNSLRLMLTDERFAASLSGGRRSVVEAMNEVLWEDPPAQNVPGRWAARDTVLGGRHIRAGDLVVLGLAAANSDPEVRADRAALTGGNNAFFSFGHGEHRCPFPAREIAEVVARAGVEVLLDRLPDLDLDLAPQELTRRPSPWLRGVSRLPVRFTPAAAIGPRR